MAVTLEPAKTKKSNDVYDCKIASLINCCTTNQHPSKNQSYTNIKIKFVMGLPNLIYILFKASKCVVFLFLFNRTLNLFNFLFEDVEESINLFVQELESQLNWLVGSTVFKAIVLRK